MKRQTGRFPDHFYVISSRGITKAARKWLIEQLDSSQRRHIIFMDRDDFLNRPRGYSLTFGVRKGGFRGRRWKSPILNPKQRRPPHAGSLGGAEDVEVVLRRLLQGVEVVAPFEEADDPAFAMRLGDLDEMLGQGREVFAFEAE